MLKRFYIYYDVVHSHSNAQVLVRSAPKHRKHFGLTIRNSHSPGEGGIYIETVENADALIGALQKAKQDWLFTEQEIHDLLPNQNTLEKADRVKVR